MKRRSLRSLLCTFVLLVPLSGLAQEFRFAVSFTAETSATPLDGRLLLMISKDPGREPRFQIADGPATQIAFGIDVDGLAPGTEAIFDSGVRGWPIDSIDDIPPGRYRVQALLHKYETFSRADGHVVKLPMDRGEGQQWNRAPGNLLNDPVDVEIDPAKGGTIRVVMDKTIPPIADPPTTKYIKHVRIQSKLLTKFWGRPMHLGAHVLVPEGFDEHPEARYPLMVFHGHFPYTFGGFREEPPDPDLESEYSARFDLEGYNRIVEEQAHQFYKQWTGPDYPRVLIIQVQHANPYYDDSYAVNSANLGPYGDAITHELIPFIEEKFRGIGEGWSRFLYGGSTGGWEALAVQVFYPDDYNGCFAACPDPIDFRAYTVVDLYEDKNAYYLDSDFKKTPRPGHRDYLGHVSSTLEEMNRRELVLGTKSRSGQQWDIWEAVYSPVVRKATRCVSGTNRLEISTKKSPSIGARTTICPTSSSAIGRRSAQVSPARSISMSATWTTTTSTIPSISLKIFSKERPPLLTGVSLTTATVPSIAGTVTTRAQTRCPGSATTRCSSR